MKIYCDRCDGDTRLIKEDDKFYYYQCIDCGNVRKIAKPNKEQLEKLKEMFKGR